MAKRSQHVVYLNEDERRAREDRADDLDMSFSEYMRELTDPAQIDDSQIAPAEDEK